MIYAELKDSNFFNIKKSNWEKNDNKCPQKINLNEKNSACSPDYNYSMSCSYSNKEVKSV